MIRLTVAAAALLAVTALVAGCGDQASSGPVAQAAKATEKAGTARFTIAEVLNENGHPVTIKGVGISNEGVDTSDVNVDASQYAAFDPTAPSSLEEIVKGGSLYFRIPEQPLPPGKTWIELTPTELSSLSGTSALVSSSSGYDPNPFLAQLEQMGGDMDWQTVGTEDVNGVPSLHYHAALDVKKLLAKRSSDLTKQQRAWKASPYATSTIAYDVWVGKDGLIHKLLDRVQGSTVSTRITVAIVFSDFGSRLTVKAPPAAATIGMQELAAAG